MPKLWKRLDLSQEYIHHIDINDEIYYAREYISGRNYEASYANNLRSNFKKPVERRNRPEWKYKIDAIKKFAHELSCLLDDASDYVFAAIPSSKCKDDPEYDSRVEDVLVELKKIRNNIIIEEPIATKTTILPSHHGGPRDPDILYNNMLWMGFSVDADQIILVDDVITTGSHFVACKRMISEHHSDVEIVGIFWAKTTWDDNPS